MLTPQLDVAPIRVTCERRDLQHPQSHACALPARVA